MNSISAPLLPIGGPIQGAPLELLVAPRGDPSLATGAAEAGDLAAAAPSLDGGSILALTATYAPSCVLGAGGVAAAYAPPTPTIAANGVVHHLGMLV